MPHAGLEYSGTVAAAAYRALAQSRPARIVLLGFSHRGGPPGVSIPDVESIDTPIGSVVVDRQSASALASAPPFAIVPERELCDHSVEIQLPLLLRAAPGVPVLPLYAGRMDTAARDAAAQALASLAIPGTVFLASSDLTHYGSAFQFLPFPPDSRIHGRLRELDFGSLEAAGSLDSQLFLDHLAATGSTLCGYAPIALLLRTLALLEGEEIFEEVLDYQTSAAITGDVRHSVSYAAAGFYRARSFELCRKDLELLLESAHATLRRLFETGRRQPVPPRAVSPALARRTGAFVSLREGSDLRGCVGNRGPGAPPLAEAIPELTLCAALDDARFRPLRKTSLPVTIEISVLSPLKRLRDPHCFRLGHHGVYLACGPRRGLLLPQVARHREWTAEEFLEAVARKAGLPHDGWSRPEAQCSVFVAQACSEVVPPL